MNQKRHSQVRPHSSLKSQTRAQTEMSFGMIFSIILIIFFFGFAFFGIKTFLGIQDTAKTTKFLSDIRADVETVWKSSQTSQEKSYDLPKNRESVCFVDFTIPGKGPKDDIYRELKRAYYGKENMVFFPLNFDGVESIEVQHLDLDAITATENPFCLENKNGKINLRLEKDLDETLVTIKRN